jgi:two-component system response regulator PilR (NtrC family)
MGLILGKSESEMYNSFTQVNDIFQTNNFSVDSYLMQIDKDILAQSLENARWNITEAAKQVGLTFRQMRYRIAKYKLVNPADLA